MAYKFTTLVVTAGCWGLHSIVYCSHTCTAVNSKLFVIGGALQDIDDKESFDTTTGVWTCKSLYTLDIVVESFDTASGVWTVQPPLRKSRRSRSAVVLGSFLYVIGGVDSSDW